MSHSPYKRSEYLVLTVTVPYDVCSSLHGEGFHNFKKLRIDWDEVRRMRLLLRCNPDWHLCWLGCVTIQIR